MNVRALVVGGVSLVSVASAGVAMMARPEGSDKVAFAIESSPSMGSTGSGGGGGGLPDITASPRRPMLVTATCKVGDLELAVGGPLAAAQPFTVTAEAVRAEGDPATMTCPVHMQLTSSSRAATIVGPQPADVIDLAVTRGEWSVTVPDPQRLTLTVTATSVDRCVSECAVPAARSVVAVVEPNGGTAALRERLSKALDDLVADVRQDGRARAGTPSHVDLELSLPLEDVPGSDVTVRLRPTEIPGGETAAEKVVRAGAPAKARFDAVVTPPTDRSFDSLVDVTLVASAEGVPVEVTRQLSFAVRVRSGNGAMRFLRTNVPWIGSLIGGGGVLGLVTANRRRRKPAASRSADVADGADGPG